MCEDVNNVRRERELEGGMLEYFKNLGCLVVWPGSF